jgi:hypothetical protein
MPFATEQLARLLTQARRRNIELGITGILFYGNQRFLQVLEGEKEVVQTLYTSIRRDPRHQNVLTYIDNPTEQRAFPEWAMAFESSNEQRLITLAGYLGSPNVPLDTRNLSSVERHVFEMLRAFTQP